MSAVIHSLEDGGQVSGGQLPTKLDLLATAPEGISELRRLILALGIRGKLVAQSPTDSPASVLLDHLRRQRGESFIWGEQSDTPGPHAVEKHPFELPSGWEFCRLGDLILSIRSGGTPSKADPTFWNGDIPWASVKDLGFGDPVESTQDSITAAGLEAGSKLARAGSILICTRMGLGKIGEAKIDLAFNQDLKSVCLGRGVDTAYFINFFKTVSIIGSGVTVAGIKQDELLNLAVPLPPAAEQARIVARVDELMRLCDALEEKGRLEAEQHARLLSSLLGTLTDSATPEELAANWQRVAEHFDLLLDRPEAVDALEQTVLQLAVQGLLVRPQHGESLALGNGSSHGVRDETPIRSAELPFEVPSAWRWVRLGSVAELINGDRGLNYPNRSEYVSEGVPFMNTGHIEPDGSLSRDTMHYLTRAKFESLRSGKTQPGDLVYCLRGATLGKTARVDYPEGAIASSLVIIRLGPEVDRDYAYCYLTGPLGRQLVRRFDNGSAQPNLAASSVRRYVLPLPPPDEQRRIVTRVTELRRLCATLRERLQAQQATQSRLAEALVEQALSA